MEKKQQQELSIFKINFSKDFAKKVSKKRFFEVLPKNVKKEVADMKWKMLCEFAGRKEKEVPQVDKKKKEQKE